MSPLFRMLCKGVAYLLNKHTAKPLSSFGAEEFQAKSGTTVYTTSREPAPASLYYDVPLIKQEHAFTCQDASEAMVKHFFGKPIPSQVRNLRWFGQTKYDDPEGSTELKTKLAEHGFVTYERPSFAQRAGAFNHAFEIKRALHDNGPCIITLPLRMGAWHSVVCVGYTKDHVIYHDPFAGGNLCLSFRELNQLAKDSGNNQELPIRVRNPETLTSTVLLEEKRTTPKQNTEFKTLHHKKRHAEFFALKRDYHYDETQACQRAIEFLKEYTGGWGWGRSKRDKDTVKDCIEELKKLNGGKRLTPKTLLETIENHLEVPAKQKKLLSEEMQERIRVIRDLFPSHEAKSSISKP